MTTLTITRPAPLSDAEIARAVRARHKLISYAEWTMPAYRAAAHHKLTADYLERVERGEIKRLMIFEPPQYGKSELSTVRFPAWALCRDPERRIITASYGADLAHNFSRRARNCIAGEESREVFPGIELATDSAAANLWHTTAGGRLLAVGIGGGVTGHGADILGIDDPTKSREEAESQTHRDKVWDWYKAEAYTRLAPDGAIVLTMTRWHEDDLAGRLLAEMAEGGEQWTVLNLPAVCEEDGDPLGRQIGDALNPERHTLEDLERIKRAVGERDWAALFQQRPSPVEGAIFKWWPRYSVLPAARQIVLPIDTAYTDDERSDYNAYAAWLFGQDRRAYLINAGRIQAEAPEAERHIAMFYHMIKGQYPGVPVRPVVRRSVAIDRIAAQHLRDKGVPVIPVRMPHGDMEALANVVAPDFEASRALAPTAAPWLEAFIEEHKSFPNGQHDDYVATTVYGLWYGFHSVGPERSAEPLVYAGNR